MCGICGIVRTDESEPIPQSLLSAMCGTIVHRGPDDEGIYLDPKAGLGARRLSIIDLETGHQPLSNEDGSVWVAYNGEIYNFPGLRQELISRGHSFATRTDTETIVHSYEEWGEDFVRRFRGMFAFALWDRKKEKLILGRDRVGIKPLYYTRLAEGTLVFGSELKAVIAHPRVERVLEPRALDLFLTLEYIPSPFSIFKNIHKLPAGHLLIYQRRQVKLIKYWDVQPEPEAAAETPKQSLSSLTDELYALLKESVRLRLISDVPLGAFLSGGIDSSTIVGLMRESGASPLKTFSIGFKDQSYDELEYARRIVRKFETQHEELILEPRALELTEKLVRHLDEPFGDFSIFPTYLVSEMARRQVKVALSGDGGDEVFGGYEHYQAQKTSRWPGVPPVSRLLSGITRRMRPSAQKKGAWNKLRRYVEGFSHDPGLRHFRWMMFLSREAKRELYAPGFIDALGGLRDISQREPFQDFFPLSRSFDRVNSELYLDLKTYLVDDILVKVDRMSMAASLEARVPLLDHKLLEFAFRLPGKLKLHGLSTKWIFKKTVERLLPKDNIYRPKQGFSIPIKHWLKTDLRDLLLDSLAEKRVREEGFFNFAAVQKMIGSHLAGRENYSHQLWALLVFAIWKENYL